MSAIPGTNIAAPIVPFDTNDTFATHDESYGKGGYRTVATFAERDAIPAARRKAGALVKVLEADPLGITGRIYELGAGLANGDWVPRKTDTESNLALSALQDEDAALRSALKSGFTTMAERVALGVYTAPVMHRFIVGGDVGTDIVPNGKAITAVFAQRIYPGTGTTKIRLNIILRPLGSSTIDLAPPQAGDIVLGPYDYTVSSLGMTLNAQNNVRLELPQAISAATIAGKAVLMDLRGLDDTNTPTQLGPGMIAANDGLGNHKRGFYATLAGPTALTTIDAGASILAWRFETSTLLSGIDTNAHLATLDSGVSANAVAAALAQAGVNDIKPTLFTGYTVLASAPPTSNFGAATNFKRWGVGIDIGLDATLTGPINAINARLVIGTGGTKVRLRLWKRPLASAQIDNTPGNASDDVLILTSDYTIGQLGLTAGAGAAIDCRMTLPAEISVASLASQCLIIDVQGLDNTNTEVLLGYGSRVNPTGLPDRKRGWYNNGSWGAINSGNSTTLAWVLETANKFDATANNIRTGAVEARATNLEAGKAAADASLTAIGASLYTSYTNRGEVVGTSSWGPGTYNRWFFGGDVGTEITIAPGQSLTHFFSKIRSYNTTTTKVRLTVLLRDLASGVLNTAGQQAGDIVAFGPTTFDLATVSGGALPVANVTADCRFPLGSGIPYASLVGKRVYFFIEGLDASDVASAIGTGFTNTASGTVAQGKRGYFGIGSLGNTIATPNQATWRVEQGVLPASGELSTAVARAANVPALQTTVAALQTTVAALDPGISLDFLLPNRFYLTAGQPVKINVLSMASKRIDQSVLDISMESLKYVTSDGTSGGAIAAIATAPKPALDVRGSGVLTLDPDAVSGSVTLTIRRRGVGNTRVQKNIPVTVTPWVKVSSPIILVIGDSLAAQSKAAALRMELIARGMTPNMLGDLDTSFNGVGLTKGEGRGGKAMADFTYMRIYDSGNANTMQPCAGNITYAAYMALTSAQRANWNPFLIAGSGAGFYNGYKFSMTQYLTYTGRLATVPTHVFISLGTNDIFQFSKATALANITAGINLMVSEIRAAAPNAYIIFYSDGCGWCDGINDPTQYYETHFQMMQTQQAAINALVAAGDIKVIYQPYGIHQDDNRFGQMFTANITTTNGQPTVTVVAGTLTAGQVLTGTGVNGLTVLVGAAAGQTATLSGNATASNTLNVWGTDAYGLRTVYDDTLQAGYVHPTDRNILAAGQAGASLVAATS